MKNKTKEIVFLTLAIACFLGFVAMWILLKVGYDFKMDTLNTWLYNHQNKGVVGFFKIFTYLGSWWVMAIFAIIITIFVKDKRVGLTCIISVAVAALLNVCVKYIVCRPRPELMLIKEIGYSFPSAHAMISFAFYGTLLYFACSKLKNTPLKICLSILLCLVVLGLGFSRIVLNVHFASDILAGFLFGFVALYISLCLGKLIKQKPQKQLVNAESVQ